MKIAELENLLNLPYSAEIELYGISHDFINEVARVYGLNPTNLFSSTEVYLELGSGDMKVTLNSFKKP